MSRNFELLAQIQAEAAAESTPFPAAIKTARISSVNVDSKCETGNARSGEMLGLVQRVFLTPNGSAPRSVLFCGVDDGLGCSSVCAGVARVLADCSSLPVCLVDANPAARHLSRMFGISTMPVFEIGARSVKDQCTQVGTNLWLAPTDTMTGSGGGVLSVSELKERFMQVRKDFEYLVFDLGAINLHGEAAVVAQVTDAAILVVEANGTRRISARKAKETLDGANVRLLGTVLHNRTFPIPEGLYRKL